MIVYLADKTQFLDDTDNREIDDIIHRRFMQVLKRSVGMSERRAWRESLTRVANVLRDSGIPGNAGVAIEFQIQQSGKRIDLMLAGQGAGGSQNAVIIELKQWETALQTPKDGIVKTFVGGAQRELPHPSYQAWSYAALLEGFNTAVYNGGISLRPCAYLHNYLADGEINAPHYAGYYGKAPLFLKGDSERDRLRSFIKEYVKAGDANILPALASAPMRPSKALADALSKMLDGNPEFVLIDEQKVVFEAGLAAGKTASSSVPRVLVVEGGPGTGKSVVAVNLLVALIDKGLNCKYVTRNAAPRAVFKAKLTASLTATRFDSLFSGSGAFMETPDNHFDVLIVDEAHRLNEKSGFYGNEGDNQIRELIAAAKCTIFFLDENQRVTLRDIGSKDLIYEFATDKGAAIEEYELPSQFRCNGSDAYLPWLDNTLGIRETANATLHSSEFDFRIFDSPVELHEAIEARNANNKARVVAGYCWPWASKNDPHAIDITIGAEYRRRWNLSVDGSLWIIMPESIEQVGCIHTCQGLELEYVGVIIGPDFIVRDERVITVPEARARQDQSIKGYKSLVKAHPEQAKRDADLIIKNTYRTLMTRGMKGCYIYCTDEETREYFRSRLTSEAAPA